MKVFVTGASGQLGREVLRVLAFRGIEGLGVSSRELDITDEAAVQTVLRDFAPDAVIHCAAYTQVDRAEEERELCRLVNAEGTRYIARVCRELGAKLVYVSTDYVFPGTGERAWQPDDTTAPLNEYGRSKLMGEQAVRENCEKHFIVRTSWVIGDGKNFVKTMLRLAESRTELRIVADQFGAPTFTADLAPLLCSMIETEKYGTYHASNSGCCTWAELAAETFRLAGKTVHIIPVSTEEYGAPASRPHNSRLDMSITEAAFGCIMPPWQTSLERYLRNLQNQ